MQFSNKPIYHFLWYIIYKKILYSQQDLAFSTRDLKRFWMCFFELLPVFIEAQKIESQEKFKVYFIISFDRLPQIIMVFEISKKKQIEILKFWLTVHIMSHELHDA